MNRKILWITETAVMLALLVTLQTVTKPLGQLVTGSAVNGVLALTVLLAGLSSGITVALASPVLAFLLGIAPQILTVPAIMAGNAVYVTALYMICGRKDNGAARSVIAWLVAAAAKFAVLYAAVVWLICGAFSERLLAAGILKAPALTMLQATFSWPQLATALIGGAMAMLLVPVLRKALHR